MTITIRRPSSGCIHRTDRGSRYRAHDDQKLLRGHAPPPSTSGKGNCSDNSAVVSFFKSLKGRTGLAPQLAHLPGRRNSPRRVRNGFCDPRRRRSALGWKSPMPFKRKAA